ncbi:DNA polymerase I [Nymphon striatum]|nr:DNA polymerase I [Nymphon striatum]
MNEQVNFARDNGYVQTVLGRRRYLKAINGNNAIVRGAAERNAVNAPIQGSAADIIKIAMINIHKILSDENYTSKMLLQVHDELVFDVYNPEMDKLKAMVQSEMENAYKMTVPLDVELAIAQTDSGQEPASRQEQKATKKIKVFPNPATNVVNVLGLINSSRATIIVSDISGNEVLAHQWAIRNNAVSIPVPNLNSGIYVVRIESKEQRVQTKFYKK